MKNRHNISVIFIVILTISISRSVDPLSFKIPIYVIGGLILISLNQAYQKTK